MSGDGWVGGPKIAGAAALAVARVNADKTLLPGRRLRYTWADSGCSSTQGLEAMGTLLGGKSTINAVIGPGCSAACEVTSHLSAGQNIPQISWGCTSHVLSDKTKHQLFSRTVSPEASKTPALIELMENYNWTNLTIQTSTDEVWLQSGLEMKRQLQNSSNGDIHVFMPAAFEPGNFKDAALSEMRRSGT